MDAWIARHCIPVEDALEDTSILYASTATRVNTLGHASLSRTVRVCVAGHELTLHQRPDYLRGSPSSVTGAVLWSTTPILLEFFASTKLFDHCSSSSGSGGTILELGSGIGASACVLGRTHRFIASDHDTHLLKLIEDNARAHHVDVGICQLDWSDSLDTLTRTLTSVLHDGERIETILCLDCVYSPHLATQLAGCLRNLASIWPGVSIILGQQLREESMHVDFLGMLLHADARLWRVDTEGEEMAQYRAAMAGYVVYIATFPPHHGGGA